MDSNSSITKCLLNQTKNSNILSSKDSIKLEPPDSKFDSSETENFAMNSQENISTENPGKITLEDSISANKDLKVSEHYDLNLNIHTDSMNDELPDSHDLTKVEYFTKCPDIQYSDITVETYMAMKKLYEDSETCINNDPVKLLKADLTKPPLPTNVSESDPMKTHCETIAILKCAVQDIACKVLCTATVAATSAMSVIKTESAKIIENFKNMLDEKVECPGNSPKPSTFDDCKCKPAKKCGFHMNNSNADIVAAACIAKVKTPMISSFNDDSSPYDVPNPKLNK